MEARHTPGPWTISKLTPAYQHIAALNGGGKFKSGLVAMVPNPEGVAELRANARLVASSPDLFDAAVAALALLAEKSGSERNVIVRLQYALDRTRLA